MEEDQTGKFTMPPDFYKRVLELEKLVDLYKERCPENLLKTLTQLYSDAIEYFGFMDNSEKCIELQIRMQSILVRPYVLDCLSRFEEKRQGIKKKEPQEKIVLKSTLKREQERKERLKAVRANDDSSDEEPKMMKVQPENEDEITKEEAPIPAKPAEIDPSQLLKTPRKHAKIPYLITYEEGATCIELPGYTEEKERVLRETPVTKIQRKKDLQSLQRSQDIVIETLQRSMTVQTDSLQSRLKQRKLDLFARKMSGIPKQGQKQLDTSSLQSPNLSNISPNQSQIQAIPEAPIEDMLGDNSILNNMDDDMIDPDFEEEDCYDDPEMLMELERKQEELQEEFLEMAYEKKHETLAELKIKMKKDKVDKTEEKKIIAETTKELDQLRKQGVKKLKLVLQEMAENEETSLAQKISELSDKAEYFQSLMAELLENTQ